MATCFSTLDRCGVFIPTYLRPSVISWYTAYRRSIPMCKHNFRPMMVKNPEKVALIENNHARWQIQIIRDGWNLRKVLGAKKLGGSGWSHDCERRLNWSRPPEPPHNRGGQMKNQTIIIWIPIIKRQKCWLRLQSGADNTFPFLFAPSALFLSLTSSEIPLPSPERYGSFLSGEAATTGPSTGFMSLPRGVRTCSLNRAPQSCYQERRHVCGAVLPTHAPPALNLFFLTSYTK